MSEIIKLEGGCLCGAIRYRIAGEPYHVTHCHCTFCRRASGAPFVTWFSIATADLLVTRGEAAPYRSSSRATRSFCGQCGTQLTFRYDASPQETDVTLCSLDQPETLSPGDHTYWRSRLPWVLICDGLPVHATTRGGHDK